MFVRVLFLLLVALNVGAGAWLLFGREPARAPPPATDPGVPELRLVSEARAPAPVPQTPVRTFRPASPASVRAASAATAQPPASAPVSAASASAAGPTPPASVLSAATTASRPAAPASVPAATSTASASASAPPAPETCMRVGPFATPAAQQAAIAKLSPHVARVQPREEPVSRSRGFLVYLVPAESHAAALEQTKALAAKGVRDYFVVGTGDMQNAVSLGVYDNPANAQTRADALEKLGFPAKVKERVDTQPAYWADVAVPAAAAFDWRTWLPARKDLQAKPIACF